MKGLSVNFLSSYDFLKKNVCSTFIMILISYFTHVC